MTELMRTKIRWSGFTGAPGFTVLHFRDFGSGDGGGGAATAAAAQEAANRTATFAQSLRTLLPSIVTVNVEPEVDVIEDTTGELVNSFGVTGALSFTGSATGAFSSAVGAVVNWRTGGVRNGRRVRGRSFIVPLASGAFGADGQLQAATQTTLQTGAAALANATGSPDLMVYARPSSPTASDGSAFVVSSSSVPRLGAVLRSRRD